MKTYLEPEEIAQLEQSCTNLRDRLLIRLPFHLGCRVTEGLSIKVEDIDFNRGTVTIIHLKRRLKLSCPACETKLSLSHLFCPKCGKRIENKNADEFENRRQRVLPVDQGTLDLLKRYVDSDGPV